MEEAGPIPAVEDLLKCVFFFKDFSIKISKSLQTPVPDVLIIWNSGPLKKMENGGWGDKSKPSKGLPPPAW